MESRRINPDMVPKDHDKLKNIAELIQKLSYRDMQKLSELIDGELDGNGAGPGDIAEVLLVVADKLLGDAL